MCFCDNRQVDANIACSRDAHTNGKMANLVYPLYSFLQGLGIVFNGKYISKSVCLFIGIAISTRYIYIMLLMTISWFVPGAVNAHWWLLSPFRWNKVGEIDILQKVPPTIGRQPTAFPLWNSSNHQATERRTQAVRNFTSRSLWLTCKLWLSSSIVWYWTSNV